MKVILSELLKAMSFWHEQASDNGWHEQFQVADFTIWVDDEGHIKDSVATQTGGDTIYIEREEDRHVR